jgi:transposase InsO family protein
MRFAFILVEKARYPVRFLCRALEVSPSGFYAWLGRDASERSQDEAALLIEIRDCVKMGRGAYGSPRVHRELRRRGRRVSRKRVERLMRENGLRGRKKKKFRNTTLSNHGLQRHKNVLKRQFDVARLNEAWAGDITCVWTTAGWLYLAVVLDLCSRRVIGWSMADHMQDELVEKALQMALERRSAPQLFHSDQGSQYASFEFQTLLRAHGIRSSMSRRANCWDNAVVESFFDSLKTELEAIAKPIAPERAQSEIFGYIEVFYNRQRLHSTLDYRTPVEFENMIGEAA